MTDDFFKLETESLHKQPHLLIAAPLQEARNAKKFEKKSGVCAAQKFRRHYIKRSSYQSTISV